MEKLLKGPQNIHTCVSIRELAFGHLPMMTRETATINSEWSTTAPIKWETFNPFYLLPSNTLVELEIQKRWGRKVFLMKPGALALKKGERKNFKFDKILEFKLSQNKILNTPKSTQKVMESGIWPEREIWQSMVEGSAFRRIKLCHVYTP